MVCIICWGKKKVNILPLVSKECRLTRYNFRSYSMLAVSFLGTQNQNGLSGCSFVALSLVIWHWSGVRSHWDEQRFPCTYVHSGEAGTKEELPFIFLTSKLEYPKLQRMIRMFYSEYTILSFTTPGTETLGSHPGNHGHLWPLSHGSYHLQL